MSQIDPQQPTRVYRGTVDEVFSHRSEIPDDAQLELRVFENTEDSQEEEGDFGGKSLLDVFSHLIGTVEGLPPDLSTNPKYMEGFGETKSLRTLDP
jgi:hypothetical protein